MLDSDSHCDEGILNGTAIVAHLKNRVGDGEVKTIMFGAGQIQSLAETAGTGSEQPVWCVSSEAAICGHEVQSGDWFERAEEDAAGEAFGFATDVHAEMKAVDLVDIRMSGGAEEDCVAGSETAMRMGGRIWLRVVRAEVGLDLHDAPGDDAGRGAMDEQLSQEPGSDALRGVLKKTARHEAARESGQPGNRFAGYLCALFHSLM